MNVEQLLIKASRTFRTIYYVAAEGNAGDALINVGFYCLSERLNVKFKHLKIDDDFTFIERDEVLIFSGGGYLNPNWPTNARPIERALKSEFPIILLPQSIVGHESLLQKFRATDTIFARETYTLDHLQAVQAKAVIYIDDDMAFHIDERIISSRPSFKMPWNLKNAVRLAFIAWHFVRSRFTRSISALRVDSESASSESRTRLINDFSLIANFGVRSQSENIMTAVWLLTLISFYRFIQTDRLHVIVGSILTGRNVYALPNNYFKVKGVLEKSVLNDAHRRRFVTWNEKFQQDPSFEK